jgi:hypothetical protein
MYSRRSRQRHGNHPRRARQVKPVEPHLNRRRTPRAYREKGSGMTTAMRLGNTVASALRQQRVLETPPRQACSPCIGHGPAGHRLQLAGLYWPRLLAIPVAAISLWLARLAAGTRAWRPAPASPPRFTACKKYRSRHPARQVDCFRLIQYPCRPVEAWPSG